MNKEIKSRIIYALHETGNYYDCFVDIRENLPENKVTEVEQFLAYLDGQDTKVGPGDIGEAYKDFQKLLPALKATFKINRSKSYKESMARRRKNIITELVPGKRIDLHSFDFPLKGAEVISYDQTTKILTLKVL